MVALLIAEVTLVTVAARTAGVLAASATHALVWLRKRRGPCDG